MAPAIKPLPLVPYIRVSTRRQGDSGLGLDGQTAAIAAYSESVGGTILATFREVESGRNSDRPELAKAIAYAKRHKARLVIAKLDRLARNVAFISTLMESKAEFVACDNPHATRFTIHILAAVAEHEAEMIGQRTRSALAAAKARGTPLGSARPGHWTGRETERALGAAKGAAKSKAVRDRASGPVYALAWPVVDAMKAEGHSLQAIADALNERNLATVTGCKWTRMQVSRLIQTARTRA